MLNHETSQAQMPLPVYLAPTPIVTVQRPIIHKRPCYTATVPVNVGYASYYAPQVPVVPMVNGPVTTMSAYYVPTVPVVQSYYAPVVTARRVRRPSLAVAPAVIQPVYWLPY